LGSKLQFSRLFKFLGQGDFCVEIFYWHVFFKKIDLMANTKFNQPLFDVAESKDWSREGLMISEDGEEISSYASGCWSEGWSITNHSCCWGIGFTISTFFTGVCSVGWHHE